VQKQVMQTVTRPGNLPNQGQGNVSSRLIALMVQDICNPFFSPLVKVVQEKAAEENFDIIVYNTDVPTGKLEKQPDRFFWPLSTRQFDGVIISVSPFAQAEKKFHQVKIPGVYIGHLNEPVMDMVDVDNFRASYEATQYLIGKGYQRIAHITGGRKYYPARERMRGYEHALWDIGKAVDKQYIYYGTFLRASGQEGMRKLLNLPHPPDAVFIGNGLMALGALGAALDMDRRVPEDIAIFSFDNIQELTDVRPQISTIDCDPEKIGQAAITRLLERIHGCGPAEYDEIVIPHRLILRDSA